MENMKELIKLVNDLYNEGYHCGIGGNKEDEWFTAWAITIKKIESGEKYTGNLVIDCFNEIDKRDIKS